MKNNEFRIRPQCLSERVKSYPMLFVQTNEIKKRNKRQSKESMRPSYSKHCSYAFVYVYLLCIFISSPIDFQWYYVEIGVSSKI